MPDAPGHNYSKLRVLLQDFGSDPAKKGKYSDPQTAVLIKNLSITISEFTVNLMFTVLSPIERNVK